MYVFLARVATQGLVILAVTMLGLGFPYSPTQVGLTLLTVGVPTLFLTFWARPTPPDPHLLANLARFVIPAALVTARLRHGRLRLPLRGVTAVHQLRPHPGPGDQRLRELHGPDLHRRRLHRGRGHHRRADRALHLRLPRLVPPHPVPRAAHPVVRRLDPARPPTGGRPCWSRVLVVAFAAVLFVPALYRLLRAHRRELVRRPDRGPGARAVVRRAQRRLPVPAARPRPRSGADQGRRRAPG